MFAPYKRLTYEVPYPPSEVEARLRECVDWPYSRTRPNLEGVVEPLSFQVWQRTQLLNTRQPQPMQLMVDGTVEPAGDGSIVNVLIRPKTSMQAGTSRSPAALVGISIFVIIIALLRDSFAWSTLLIFLPLTLVSSLYILWFRFWAGVAVEFLDEILLGIVEDNEPAPWQVR